MRLVLGALRAHRAQTAALFLLAVLAVAEASAAVGFGAAAVAEARAAEAAAYGPAHIVVRGSAADPALRDRLATSGLTVATGDGTVQLPPAMLDLYPPGTLLSVEEEDGTLNVRADPGRG
jgi:hypothetical protein